MNELSDRVRGVRQLPLFPLPVVLFPGTPLPLHIFEPRYRQMLKDIQITNQLFGVSFFDASESESNVPPLGHIGCAAELRDVQELPDGRSNILCIGLMRYEVEEYLDEGEPYLLGKVSFFEDDEESDEILQPKAQKVRDLFKRIANSVRILSDERGELPDFPETSPQQLSYFIAATIEFDLQLKYEMFKTRSTSERLDQLQSILKRAAEQFEDRADIHKVAKHNGHSKKKLDLDNNE